MNRLIAIDPGLDGAIVVLEGDYPSSIHDMPTKVVNKKRFICEVELTELIMGNLSDEGLTQVIVEKVGASPRMAPGAAFNFGCGYGIIHGICAGLCVPCFTITPQKWKARMGLLGAKSKDASRQKILEMFPELSATFKRKKDNDRAEALLIGLAWRKMEK